MSELFEQKPNSVCITITDEENKREDKLWLAGRDFDEVFLKVKDALAADAPKPVKTRKRRAKKADGFKPDIPGGTRDKNIPSGNDPEPVPQAEAAPAPRRRKLWTGEPVQTPAASAEKVEETEKV